MILKNWPPQVEVQMLGAGLHRIGISSPIGILHLNGQNLPRDAGDEFETGRLRMCEKKVERGQRRRVLGDLAANDEYVLVHNSPLPVSNCRPHRWRCGSGLAAV